MGKIKKKKQYKFEPLKLSELYTMPYDTARVEKRQLKKTEEKTKADKIKYEASEEGIKKKKKKRETEEIQADIKLKKAKRESSPKGDFDRYLKDASNYFGEGWDLSTVDKEQDGEFFKERVVLDRPGPGAEKAREAYSAYVDSMGVAQDAMDLGMTTPEVRKMYDNTESEMKEHLNSIFEEELDKMQKEAPGSGDIANRMATKKALIKFVGQHGKKGKQYLASQNIKF